MTRTLKGLDSYQMVDPPWRWQLSLRKTCTCASASVFITWWLLRLLSCNTVIDGLQLPSHSQTLLTVGVGLCLPSQKHISIYLWCQEPDWCCYVNNLWFQRPLLQLHKVNTQEPNLGHAKNNLKKKMRVGPTAAADRGPGIIRAGQTCRATGFVSLKKCRQEVTSWREGDPTETPTPNYCSNRGFFLELMGNCIWILKSHVHVVLGPGCNIYITPVLSKS